MLKIIFVFAAYTLLISGEARSQTLKLNSFDNKKIDRPANTYQPEQKYFCELSRIGKLVVKPLMKDSVIHYELAIQDRDDERIIGQSGVSISGDSLRNTHVIRFHRQKNKILHLGFVQRPEGNNCTYGMNVLSEKGVQINAFILDGNGTVIQSYKKEMLSNEERINAQREVNAWLTYFE